MYTDHTQESRMHGSHAGEPPHARIATYASNISCMHTHTCYTQYLYSLPPVNTTRFACFGIRAAVLCSVVRLGCIYCYCYC